MDDEPAHILFICSMNQWRSPTAEELYRKEVGLRCRSAGTSSRARRKVSVKDIRWADLIVVMEAKHLERLRSEFRDELRSVEIEVLEVEDRYQYMDPRLIEELKAVLDPLLLE